MYRVAVQRQVRPTSDWASSGADIEITDVDTLSDPDFREDIMLSIALADLLAHSIVCMEHQLDIQE